jgi:hypothetical protein
MHKIKKKKKKKKRDKKGATSTGMNEFAKEENISVEKKKRFHATVIESDLCRELFGSIDASEPVSREPWRI